MGGRSKNVLMKRSHGLGDMTMMAKKLHHIFGSNNSAEEKRAIIGLLNIADDKKTFNRTSIDKLCLIKYFFIKGTIRA